MDIEARLQKMLVATCLRRVFLTSSTVTLNLFSLFLGNFPILFTTYVNYAIVSEMNASFQFNENYQFHYVFWEIKSLKTFNERFYELENLR